MRKLVIKVLLLGLLPLGLAGCGWKPDVTQVPISEPWSAMKLPVAQDAIVFKSEAKEFRAVHKADKATTSTGYIDALKADGWELEKFDSSTPDVTAEMTRGAETIVVRFYDFDKTGVAIEKK